MIIYLGKQYRLMVEKGEFFTVLVGEKNYFWKKRQRQKFKEIYILTLVFLKFSSLKTLSSFLSKSETIVGNENSTEINRMVYDLIWRGIRGQVPRMFKCSQVWQAYFFSVCVLIVNCQTLQILWNNDKTTIQKLKHPALK